MPYCLSFLGTAASVTIPGGGGPSPAILILSPRLFFFVGKEEEEEDEEDEEDDEEDDNLAILAAKEGPCPCRQHVSRAASEQPPWHLDQDISNLFI